MRTAAAVAVLNCPSCGGGLGPTAVAGSIDCPSCGQPLAVHLPGSPPRLAGPETVGAERARARALSAWHGPLVEPGFPAAAEIEEPQLVFVAFYEIERTLARGPTIVESVQSAPAVEVAELPVSALRTALADPGRRVPFDPLKLQTQGTVFDPAIDPKGIAPLPESRIAPVVLEEVFRIVYVPFWIVRCRYRSNLYQAAVSGTTGELLEARAPAPRTARLPSAIAALYLLAAITALLGKVGWIHLYMLIRLRELGLAAAAAFIGGLAWLIAFSWDRIRFRYEVATEGSSHRLVPINRPPKTLPEKAADALFEAAGSVVHRRSGNE